MDIEQVGVSPNQSRAENFCGRIISYIDPFSLFGSYHLTVAQEHGPTENGQPHLQEMLRHLRWEQRTVGIAQTNATNLETVTYKPIFYRSESPKTELADP